MPSPVTVKFVGGRELSAALEEMAAGFDLSKTAVRNTMKRALVDAGQVTADRASALAPDDPNSGSPDLHRSIAAGTRLTDRQRKLAKKNDEKSFAEAHVGVTKDANAYGHLVEFGTANTAPQPFMRPAWDETKDKVLSNISGSLSKQIEKTAARARRKALKKAGK